MGENVIIQNALKISRGSQVQYLNSKHNHDYVIFNFGDGSHVFLDGGDIFSGGGYYSRSNIYIQDGSPVYRNGYKVEDWFLHRDSTWDKICERLLWGHRGKDGKSPLTRAPLSSFEKSHLENILKNVPSINPLHKSVVEYLLATKQF